MKKLIKLLPILFFSVLVSACTVLPTQPSTKLNFVDLADGQTFELTAAPFTHQIGRQLVSMLAYNGSIPGPVLRVVQGSSVKIILNNQLATPTTLHAHGIRMENQFDGVPDVTQDAIEPGDSFEYELEFPDAGVFWYHPHVREDRDQELGLYGVILVTPKDQSSWSKVAQEEILVLDDILLPATGQPLFDKEVVTHALMGRYGNAMLINGQQNYQISVEKNSPVRLYLVNAANARPFNLVIPGASIVLIGSDNGLFQESKVVDSVIIGPSERMIVDVTFPQSKKYYLENSTPEKIQRLTTFVVTENQNQNQIQPATINLDPQLEDLKGLLAKPADKTLGLSMVMGGAMGGHESHGGGMMMGGITQPIEWEDNMGQMNAFSTNLSVTWQLIDRADGKINHNIYWQFNRGEIIKIRVVNDINSMHPMQHPIHLHGQRFAVIAIDGQPVENLVWKDTTLVPTGKTFDLAVAMENPGKWVLHCHIPEHMESGMMTTFEVM